MVGAGRLSGAAQHTRWVTQRPTLSMGRQRSEERKGGIISDSVSLQGPVQFYVLRNRNQRNTGEGAWEAGRKCRVPWLLVSSGSTLTESRHREGDHMRNTYLQRILGCRASFKRKLHPVAVAPPCKHSSRIA